MCKKTIIIYSIPAYGHTYSMLYLMHRLKSEGYSIIYYSLEPFREEIEANGCTFRSYPMDEGAIDLTDGKRLLRLYRLLLEHTTRMLRQLLNEARMEEPAGVMFDSLALWGRAVGDVLKVPRFSFYSILAIDRMFSKSFFCYAAGFSTDFFKYAGELPAAFMWRRYLRERYGIRHLGMFPVLMNRGDYQLMGYSRQMQPGGAAFGKRYLFLGNLSQRRILPEQPGTDAAAAAAFSKAGVPLIYISLGTVFNDDQALFDEVVKQLGNQDVQVIMAAKMRPEIKRGLPVNFMVKPFWNQQEVLERADLFLSAGGMNSIHDALFCGVPCLFYPQQGEQYLNARQFAELGFGLMLKESRQLGAMAKQAMGLKDSWSEELRAKLTKVNVTQALQVIKYETAKVNDEDEKSISDRGNRIFR